MPARILPLAVEGLGFSAGGETLLAGISFEVAEGARTVILGPNGAGKSLTLRLCHGLLAPTRGKVAWLGPDAAAPGRHQAMVFQRPVLLRRSALANVAYALKVNGVRGAEREARAKAALEAVGLAQLAHRPARVLSGGEQQLVALARAAALSPEVLFLDEPTASLAPGATRAVEAAIRAVHQAGATVVMTTHDLGQARRLAHEILFLHGGMLVERSSAARFFESPQSAEGRAFIQGELL